MIKWVVHRDPNGGWAACRTRSPRPVEHTDKPLAFHAVSDRYRNFSTFRQAMWYVTRERQTYE